MGNLVNCKACGKEIAKGVKKCPHCGKDQRNFFMHHKIITGIGIIIILAVIGAALGGGKGNSGTASKPSSSTASTTTVQDNKKYSMDKFNQIKMDMTYAQVKAILGDGTEDSSTDIGGVKSVMYSWKNSDGSNISVTLQGDKVDTKAQAFLQSMNAKVTMDKYNKINTGMTYDQVKAILGEGELTSQSKILDVEGEIYSWINSDGTNMSVTFQGGAVNTKTQFNLK